MVLLGDQAQLEALLVRLKIVLDSVQGRCMICTKCTMASEILLDAPDGTPR
jgi:hypothetical protein